MSSPASQRNTLPARVARLTRKELKETLRDRRTIVTLIVMPLLVYPLLSIAFQRFVLATMPAKAESAFRLGFADETDARAFVEFLLLGDQMAKRADDPRSEIRLRPDRELQIPQTDVFIVENPADAVTSGDVDLGIRIRRVEKIEGPVPAVSAVDAELMYDPDSINSREALERVERRLALVNSRYLELRLEQVGVKGRLSPVEVSRVAIDVPKSPISFPLATLVPFVLILTTITGAVYPAIDLTAGERERGTLEMLIAAPVPRMGLLIAKYVAVVTVAMLTAVVNCGAMMITVYSVGLGKQLFGERGLTFELAIEFCGLLLLFAAFFSAVLLALTSFARSFKEAQAYLVPLMLASTAPGIFTMINGVRLTPLLAVTPLANIVLLARDMFEYNASPGLSLLVLISTLIYALIAIVIAARLFGSDAVLYGSPGSWSETFTPATHVRNAASLGTALLTMVAISPVYILISNLLAQQSQAHMSTRLGLAALATLTIFGCVPLGVSRWQGVRFAEGLGLRRPPLVAMAAAVLLGVSLWPFAHEIMLKQQELGWITLDKDKLSRAAQIVEQLRYVSPAWVVVCMGLVPAFAEELFFRGFLQNALRTRQSVAASVAVSAVVFGLFHVIVTDSLLVERFLPTTLLGLVLGWLAVQSGSIWPGVLLHATHNGLLLLIAYYEPELAVRGWGVQEQSHLPGNWLIAAGVTVGIGYMLARLARPIARPSAPIDST